MFHLHVVGEGKPTLFVDLMLFGHPQPNPSQRPKAARQDGECFHAKHLRHAKTEAGQVVHILKAATSTDLQHPFLQQISEKKKRTFVTP